MYLLLKINSLSYISHNFVNFLKFSISGNNFYYFKIRKYFKSLGDTNADFFTLLFQFS